MRAIGHDIRRSYLWLLALGCALLGFSTEPGAAVGVQAFGLPFFALACLLAIPVILVRRHQTMASELTAFLLLMCVLVGWMCITSLVAPYPWVSLSRALVNLMGLTIVLGFVYLADGRRLPSVSWRVPAWLGLVATAITALYFLLNLLEKSMTHGFEVVILERFVGGLMSLPWGASNNIASVLLIGLGLALLLRRRIHPAVLYGLILLHLAAILMTFSRNGLVTGLLMVLLGLRNRERLVVIAAACALLATFFNGNTSWTDIQGIDELLENRATGGGDISNARVDIWIDRLQLLARNPFHYTGYYSTIFEYELSAHNFALNTLLEQGLPGLLLSLAMLLGLFTLTRRVEPVSPGVPMTFSRLWLVMTLNMAAEDPNFTQPFILVFWLAVASQVLLRMSPPDRDHAASRA